MITNLTKSLYEQEVASSDKPVLIDFYADWCGPCKMAAPILAEIEKEYSGKINVFKVNVDDEEELAAKFKVGSIPTFILIKNNSEAGRKVGFRGKDDLLKMLGL